MEFDGYVACICEGSAEQAIIERLLEFNLLLFTEGQLLEKKILRCRSAQNFERQYLGKSFKKKITVLRILDSKKENFKLSKAYQGKIEVINVVTAPEIEMLIICHENKYEDYKKSKLKPSDFCLQRLRLSKVKEYTFVKDYFSNPTDLVIAIRRYQHVSKIPDDQMGLNDLLK